MFDKVVLVVAEDGRLGSLLRALIRHEVGCHTVGAGVDVALERIRKGNPAAVVIDITPPKCHGLEIIEQVKEDAITAAIPVIALTQGEKGSAEAREAGCNVCVGKPLDLDGLVSVVANCLKASVETTS